MVYIYVAISYTNNPCMHSSLPTHECLYCRQGGLQDPAKLHRKIRNEEGAGDTSAGTRGSQARDTYERNQQSWNMPAPNVASLSGSRQGFVIVQGTPPPCWSGRPCINISSPRRTAKQKGIDIDCCWKHLGKGQSGRKHNSRTYLAKKKLGPGDIICWHNMYVVTRR